MSLVSNTFILFVMLSVLVYYILPKKVRWWALLVSSYVYYLAAGAEYLVFILFSTLVTYVCGILIEKKRYLIPLTEKLTIELDVFEGKLAPLVLAEVEFETKEEAERFVPPAWFGEDVTFSSKYHNSTLSKR